jgi:hypothetical protein
MYLLLLVFGALLAVAGVILAAPGVSLHQHAFDAATATPGIVAVIGGLVLCGLGLALRILQRIEQTLAARPMPRAERTGDPTLPAGVKDLLGEAASAANPSKSFSRRRPGQFTTLVPSASADEKRPEETPEKLPAAARFETARAAELDLSPKSVVPKSLLSQSLSGEDDAIGEAKDLRFARRSNGAASSRITPRLDMNARSPLGGDRSTGPSFETMWPKGPRPSRAIQQPAPEPFAEPTAEPEPNKEPVLELPSPAVATDESPVTILKSGVVDGMAYTLFSDGSIEADLPQGKLRFGSITELRNHIEQSA